MTDEVQVPAPDPVEKNPVVEPTVAAPTPGKSRRSAWIIFGALAGVVCLVALVCGALGASALGKTFDELPQFEKVLDQFMRYMEARDTEHAYGLMSPRFQQYASKTQLEKMTQSSMYVLFEGYQGLAVSEWNVGNSWDPDPRVPQGFVANVEGTIVYEGGFTGTLEAALEKVDGVWRITTINVVVPPDKFQ